ncbi:MAG: helix-turn-helix transcriptional regulator [Bacteroidia bacterium]|nr:helix-turn-helix transcriptional regulator [Bacteroidia bacterium]
MHIGNRIKEVLQEKGMTVTEFARLIPCTRENAHRILLKHDMDTGLLRKISAVLEHDFFLDISHCD